PDASRRKPAAAPLTVLWITPMRALAADTARALQRPMDELGLPWTLGLRTGDTGSAERARQSRRLPSGLTATAERRPQLLTPPGGREACAGLRVPLAGEWHELLGSKRGEQLQLALARWGCWRPGLQVGAPSPPPGDLEHAREVLMGECRLIR